jgi:hypothetical protein
VLGAALSGEGAAHVHLAAATGTDPDGAVRYLALRPRRLEAVYPDGSRTIAGIDAAESPVAEVVRANLALFSAPILLGGVTVPTLTREAVAADLLARGGLSLGVLGVMLRVGPVDADEVREILKAARQGERFQPLLELLDVA